MENETNKSYRIRTNINKDSNVLVNFTQEYETFELLSIKMKTENLYRLHNANYGVVVGRVQANGGFGVPNAKISIFIEVDQENENSELLAIYGYTDVFQTNSLGNTYNLLPDEQVSDCHKKIGAFPSKRYLLDNDTYIEIFDKYYKYTTRTNDAGDYIIVGVPVGNQTLHMDLDLSDCGILSQRPRDFVYKGYNIEQFDNPNQFKSETGASINFLSQYIQQTKTVYVNPLWGNNELGETLGITRADIDVNFKFEPTCVFMGSVVSDSRSNGISMKCVPTDQMGMMDELTTGKGTIEMIRKTPTGDVEEFQIKGNELIDGNGTWCYQIPMNLDYVTTNEYGETVATDNPNIGIPTRARVRFRVSLDNFEESNDNYFAGKVLVPNNPKVIKENGVNAIDYDYAFGTNTGDDSYRDLFWNNVYSVKQHIPRVQKSGSWRTDRFTGIKQCNFYGQNNPIPYNSIRIKLPFMYVVLCALIKTYVRIVSFLNGVLNAFFQILTIFMDLMIGVVILLYPIFFGIYLVLKFIDLLIGWLVGHMDLSGLEDILSLNIREWPVVKKLQQVGYITIADGICPDLESWYFAPALLANGVSYCPNQTVLDINFSLCQQTISKIENEGEKFEDPQSTDKGNKDTGAEKICITKNLDYLMSCIEMNLAQEYKVIKFDFYNDWINGLLYIPRWKFRPEHKITFLFGLIKFKVKTKGCFDDNSIFGRTRWLTQHCSLGYKQTNFNGGYKGYAKIGTQNGCASKASKQKCHKNPGIRHTSVFGPNGGVIHQEKTMVGQIVYYYKPSEMSLNQRGSQTKINMFATDIILLGSLKDCDENGVPQSFKWLSGSSYKMPTNLALTNLDEAGVVYVDGDSYCSGGNTDDTTESKKVGVAENSFAGQVQWSSTAPIEMQIMGYGKGPNSVETIVKTAVDRIALTEAAGISWDYNGPSQASDDANGLFTPGGHFLGMSCINSKTNIKSCVNLQRICEAGVTMSERIEKTMGLKLDSNNNYKQQFAVFSPNGLVSTDEVIAGSFRSMFATMNLSPLIATKKDPNTGYPIYDFKYVRANGFEGGADTNIVSKSSNYNRAIPEAIPDDYAYDSGSVPVDDIDPEERKHTYHRAIEATNFGYYRFRFGLSDTDTKAFNAAAASRYALTDGLKYLPQYENSFYFYFGLKDGNTALDRLYSDFFSMCPTRQQSKKPSVKIKNSGLEICTREQSIFVTCEDIEYPYDIEMTNGSNTIRANSVMYKTVNICGLSEGEWSISVTDSSGFSVIKKVKIGANIRGIEYDFNDFKERLETYFLKDNERLFDTASITKNPRGGELKFKFDDITVFGTSIDGFKEKYGVTEVGLVLVSSTGNSPSDSNKALVLKYNDNKKFSHNPFVPSYFYSGSTMGEGERNRYKTDFEFGGSVIESIKSGAVSSYEDEIGVYLWGDKLYYTLYFIYKCGNDNLYSALSLCSFYSYGYELFNVYVGSKYLKYNGKNNENFSLSSSLLSVSGSSVFSSYRDIINGINTITGETTKWALRHALFDQRYDITVDSSDRLIRCTNLYGEYIDGLTFGQPEHANVSDGNVEYQAYEFVNADKTINGIASPISSNAYMSFHGYEIDDTASLLPSVTIDGSGKTKLPYHKISYDIDSSTVLSESVCTIKIDDASHTFERTDGKIPSAKDGEYQILKTNSSVTGVQQQRAYILQSKKDKDILVECSYVGDGEFIAPKEYWDLLDINLANGGNEFDVYPTLLVPIIHKPFYFESYPFILGEFTALGSSTLSVEAKESTTNKTLYLKSRCGGYGVKPLCYGDRELSYKLTRDSEEKNKVTINDYIKIYGGNACGPDYYLSNNSTHFGENFSKRISVEKATTGNTISHVDDVYPVKQEQPTMLEVKLATGVPETLTDTEAINELTAFVGGGDDLSALEVTTSYSIENFLPKEIVIKKKKVKEDGVDQKTALIKEDRYLDVGDFDEYTAVDINKRVKLYMVIIPDNSQCKFGSEMEKCIFDENALVKNKGTRSEEDYGSLFNRSWMDGHTYYCDTTRTTLKKLLSPITLADYFSNPKAVAFLYDQVINAAHFAFISRTVRASWGLFDIDAIDGKIHGGYFKRPTGDKHITPGLVFGNYEFNEIYPYPIDIYNVIYKLESPFLNTGYYFNYNSSTRDSKWYACNPWTYPEGWREANLDDIKLTYYSVVSGTGKIEYADIATSIGSGKRDNKTLIGVIGGTKLCKSMKDFGFGLSVVYKYDKDARGANEDAYPKAASVSESYCDKLNQNLGVENITESCLQDGAWDALHLDTFDKIIGRNWSFPNIEYVISGTPNKGKYDDFAKHINEEYERVLEINKQKQEGDEKETPNYARIIAQYFIDSTFDVGTRPENIKKESETLKELYTLAGNSNESFIVPIVLGERRDENGELKSSFVWPGASDKYTINRDKEWCVNKITKYALGHSSTSVVTSEIEDSIYAENLSYGFRSVVIGIYDGPETGDNSFKDTKNKTGNIIRPFKIYTYHHKGTNTFCNADLSRTQNTHTIGEEFMPNDYYNRRTNPSGKQKTEHLGLYYYHSYENDYDQYASGWF